jgi:hypothetical protein
VFNEVQSHSGWAFSSLRDLYPRFLVRLAEEACLLVVGTRQPTRANRYRAGSASRYCIIHAIRPVVTVPAIPATGTGEHCGGYRVQKSDAVSAAAYGVGEAGTSDRHVEACLPLEFGGRVSHVE